MRGNLTLNLGVRYEYVSPLTEENNLIANLDLSPQVFVAGPLLPPSAVSCGCTRQARPLQRQSSRQPGKAGSQRLRAPRGNRVEAVFENRGARRIWNQLQHGCVSNDCAATGVSAAVFDGGDEHPEQSRRSHAAEWFSAAGAGIITNSYAVNPNYRFGYVQIRNLDIQQQIRPTLLLNIDYTGTKGTNLDILEAPNRTISSTMGISTRIAEVQAFTFENSIGDSEANAGSVRLRKRLATWIFDRRHLYVFEVDRRRVFDRRRCDERGERSWFGRRRNRGRGRRCDGIGGQRGEQRCAKSV